MLDEADDDGPEQRDRRIDATLLPPVRQQPDEKRIENVAERTDEVPQRTERFARVRLLGRRTPPEPEELLPPVFALFGAEERRIDLEESLKALKSAFASFQRRVQPSTSPFLARGT